MFFYGYDPTYVLVIAAFFLTLFASFGVKSTLVSMTRYIVQEV